MNIEAETMEIARRWTCRPELKAAYTVAMCFTLALRSKGKRERQTRRICREYLGEGACDDLIRADELRHQRRKA